MEFSEKLIQLRKKQGMSQEQLADRMGITRQSVSKWESGGALPELSKLITLSEMFQVSIDYLVKDGEYQEEDRYTMQEESEREESRRLEEKVDNIVRYMRGYHYTSKTTIKGVPLVCVRLSRRLGRDGVAKGIIAVGNVAIGVVSFGCVSVGVISIGCLGIGILALGPLAVGLLAIGAMAAGIVAVGSFAVGIYAAGAAAIGKEVAVGAAAFGDTAIGESVKGAHCLKWYSGLSAKEAERFILESHPRLWRPLLKLLAAMAGSM